MPRSARVRSARAISASVASHVNWSVPAVPYSADAPTNTGQAAMAVAAMTCARRWPPNSAASTAVSSTHPIWAAMATIRSGHSPPGSAEAAAASSGVRGGWSTYPHAGCLPQMT